MTMIKNNNDLFAWLGNSFAVVLTAIQENPIYQIISFILTTLSVVISIAFTCWKWYNKAKADGKITNDEINELQNDLEDAIKRKEEDKDD